MECFSQKVVTSTLDVQSDFVRPCKVHCGLDIVCVLHSDDIDRVSSTTARGGGIRHTAVIVVILPHATCRMVGMKGAGFEVVLDILASVSIVVGLVTVASRRRRKWLEKSSSNGCVQRIPCGGGRPFCR